MFALEPPSIIRDAHLTLAIVSDVAITPSSDVTSDDAKERETFDKPTGQQLRTS